MLFCWSAETIQTEIWFHRGIMRRHQCAKQEQALFFSAPAFGGHYKPFQYSPCDLSLLRSTTSKHLLGSVDWIHRLAGPHHLQTHTYLQQSDQRQEQNRWPGTGEKGEGPWLCCCVLIGQKVRLVAFMRQKWTRDKVVCHQPHILLLLTAVWWTLDLNLAGGC